jgi:hypothetical protein
MAVMDAATGKKCILGRIEKRLKIAPDKRK